MRRTGPLRRSFDDSGIVTAHVEFFNTDKKDRTIELTVLNIDLCPPTPLGAEQIVVPAGCWNFGSAFVPPDVLHWEVLIRGDEDVLATVYHFRESGERDDSLTYRETELIGD